MRYLLLFFVLFASSGSAIEGCEQLNDVSISEEKQAEIELEISELVKQGKIEHGTKKYDFVRCMSLMNAASNEHKSKQVKKQKSPAQVGEVIGLHTDVVLINAPYAEDVGKRIARTTYSIFDKRATHLMWDYPLRVHNVFGQNRFVKPMRATYIPEHHTFTVLDVYHSNSAKYLLLQYDNKPEIIIEFYADFYDGIFTPGIHLEKPSHDYLTKFEQPVIYSWCPVIFKHNRNTDAYKPPEPWDAFDDFINKFELHDEIEITSTDTSCEHGRWVQFNTLEAFMTFEWFSKDWGAYGKLGSEK